ncbi:MAG: hypothetical protein K8L99_15935 [Anaerolineae bacterium]|nr:hypothetical protein [Anaerolineae bacterium]
MKKLYIHIGYPKTATSSIQQGLHQNSAELALHGYCYPATGLIGVGKHALAHDIQGNVHSRIQQLIREMRSGSLENFILSSERFATFSRPEIEQLQRVCADFDTYIVVYLRQQDAFIQSLWSQKSKIGVQRGSFVDWVDVLLATPGYNVGVADEGVSPIPVVLDYEQTLRMWARVFGLDHILVRPFERSQLHPNILVDLLQTCGMQDTAWVPEAPQVNVTPSMKTTEVLRTLGERLRPTMDTQDSRYGVYQVAFNMM